MIQVQTVIRSGCPLILLSMRPSSERGSESTLREALQLLFWFDERG